MQAALNAANYMSNHLTRDISIADLCSVTGVTDRTLRNGFQELFGISPNKWLKLERLVAVRRELNVADPKHDQVSQIANKYGFSQLGHFAKEYKQRFGESPSETLRK